MDIGTDQMMRGIYALLLLVLVTSSLIARRLPIGGIVRLGLMWIAIFAVLLGAFKWAQDQGWVAGEGGETPAALPQARTEGQALRIPVAADGHYWVEGTINGTPVRFLIDSGASVTALSAKAAQAAGLNFDPNAPGVTMMTANGRIEAQTSSVGTLALGPIRASDLPVVISPSFGEVNVIGMNMLSRLSSWGVRDGEMVLTP